MPTSRTPKCDRLWIRQISPRPSRISILRWNDCEYRLILSRGSIHITLVMVGMLFSQDITEIRENNNERGGSNDCTGKSMAKINGKVIKEG
jgi:hypothetical protein